MIIKSKIIQAYLLGATFTASFFWKVPFMMHHQFFKEKYDTEHHRTFIEPFSEECVSPKHH